MARARKSKARTKRPSASTGRAAPLKRKAAARPRGVLRGRLAAFTAERHPAALETVLAAFSQVMGRRKDPAEPEKIDALRGPLREALRRRASRRPPAGLPEPSPGVSVRSRLSQAAEELARDVDGFLHREALSASFTPEEKRWMLEGMVLTRATDNRLKEFFLSGEVKFEGRGFQGKGFRSLGQEAIYAGALRLRRGEEWRGEDGGWKGDVVAPVIRDLGIALAMSPDVASALNAQMGKAGPPMNGKDLHIGDWESGVLPATAPLAVSSLTGMGVAYAFKMRREERVVFSFIGEGGSSQGEWHEAINQAAARNLPVAFCLQNNQTALSTPVADQSAVRTFADKAAGYGIPGFTVDGTDPESIAAGFAWCAEHAREGRGPSLIEVVALRMCGHAHHDDMLYHGREPEIGRSYPPLPEGGYADPKAYRYWAGRDPIVTYARRLVREGVIGRREIEGIWEAAEETVDAAAREIVARPWPDPAEAGVGVLAGEPPRVRLEPLAERGREGPVPEAVVEEAPPFDRQGSTFLEAITRACGEALESDPRVFVFGEDVAVPYGNAFLLLRPLSERFGDRLHNSILGESAVVGVCVGAALAGMRPIGEIQFNDFIATGFNQLVNNAAKIRYRFGLSVPMVMRMPWGGLRHAGPYHSQNTEPWFYRTPGLKIAAPSTPHDARRLFLAAVEDPDPVLFYEHIALYRNPRLRQVLPEEPEPLPLGRAALRRGGGDLSLVSYGAYVHHCLEVAETLAREDGLEAEVLDLRTLAPLDREALFATVRRTGRLLLAHEDSVTGGVGQSLAALVEENLFEFLDAPIRVVGALDTPVPYAPTLERATLAGTEHILRAARLLAAY